MFCSTDKIKDNVIYQFCIDLLQKKTNPTERKANPNMCFAFLTVYFDNSVVLQNSYCILIASPSSYTCCWWMLKAEVLSDNLFNLSLNWCWQNFKDGTKLMSCQFHSDHLVSDNVKWLSDWINCSCLHIVGGRLAVWCGDPSWNWQSLLCEADMACRYGCIV